MEVYSVFITGANRNRGIGLEFVRQLVGMPKPPAFIFATYRSKDGIQALEEIRDNSKQTKVVLIKMDVTKKNEIEAARKITEDMVGDKGLTLLINNAAVVVPQKFPDITEENLLFHFKANTIGPMLIIQEFLPLLKKAADVCTHENKMGVNKALVLNISAAVGSITLVPEMINPVVGTVTSYRISKAALNMASRVIAENVKDQGILVVSMCPGWVKTDLGGEYAQLETHESVSEMLKTLTNLNESHRGKFMDRSGKLYEF